MARRSRSMPPRPPADFGGIDRNHGGPLALGSRSLKLRWMRVFDRQGRATNLLADRTAPDPPPCSIALPGARHRAPAHQTLQSVDQWPDRAHEPGHQGRHREGLPLREPGKPQGPRPGPVTTATGTQRSKAPRKASCCAIRKETFSACRSAGAVLGTLSALARSTLSADRAQPTGRSCTWVELFFHCVFDAADRVLSFTSCAIHLAFRLHFGIARHLTSSLFHFTAGAFRRAFHSILIHSHLL